MARKTTRKKQPKTIASTQSLSSFVKSICDIMRRSNCASALQYVPELTWILFLRILDAQEEKAKGESEAVGAIFTPALASPYRWQDWAAPHSEKADHPKTGDGKPYGWKRQELFAAGDGKLFDFIIKELLPHLHGLDIDARTGLPNPSASRKQRIIGRIMTAVERVRVDSETNLRDILDKVHEINIDHVEDTHFFTLSQVYEDLLLKMGEKNSDGGQFFTPREVIRATYAALFEQAPKFFDYILTNPPFGGKEGKDAQKHFAFETSSTQVLFVQDIFSELALNGTCAIVLDEGLLFRTNESAFVETKRKLVDECDLWATVSLPGGVFSTAGAGVKTNLLFFTKGRKSEKIWYYDLSSVKVGKKTPLTLAHFGFDKDGSVLAEAQLPAILVTDWKEDEANAAKSFPSYASLLPRRGTLQGESRYS